MTGQMNEALDTLVDHMVDDFARWTSHDAHTQRRIELFHAGVEFHEGRKYIKVVTGAVQDQKSVWGFIVKEEDGQFKAGDILKPASWNSPARNKPRGNILQGDYSWVRWTGPEYL